MYAVLQSFRLVVVLDNGGLLADIKTVEELSDILVLDAGGLLDEGRWLGHRLDGVAEHNQLVLEENVNLWILFRHFVGVLGY